MGKENSNLYLYFLTFLFPRSRHQHICQSSKNMWLQSMSGFKDHLRHVLWKLICVYWCRNLEKRKFTDWEVVVRPKAEMLRPFEKFAARQAVIVIILKVLGMFIRLLKWTNSSIVSSLIPLTYLTLIWCYTRKQYIKMLWVYPIILCWTRSIRSLDVEILRT